MVDKGNEFAEYAVQRRAPQNKSFLVRERPASKKRKKDLFCPLLIFRKDLEKWNNFHSSLFA